MKNLILISWLLLYAISCKSQSPERFGIDTAEGELPQGLNINDIAPDFATIDQHGDSIKLFKELEKGKVVLFFYRGNWCPFCNTYLANMQDSLPFILSKGATVIAVSPESFENVTYTSEKINAGFHIISERGNRIMNDYRVLFNVTNWYETKIKVGLFNDIAEHNNQDKAQLPIPATYIIDKNKKIIYRHFNIDFKKRAPINDILKSL